MSEARTAAYGTWPSPVSAEMVAAQGIRIGGLCADGDDLLWTEMRPAESARFVICRHRAGATTDILPAPWSARSFVHEYGGGQFTARDSLVVFSNAADSGLYALYGGGDPRPVVVADGHRFADMQIHPLGDRLVSVVEEHGDAGVENRIELIGIDGTRNVLARGRDFYAAPRISPDGSRIAWLCWDQPEMPWDGCELWVAELDDRGVAAARRISGGRRQSAQQPQWTDGGSLLFIDDPQGWWNLHEWDGSEVRVVLPMEAECGLPMWVFGISTYAQLSDGSVAVVANRDGTAELWLCDREGGSKRLDVPWVVMGGLAAVGGRIAMAAASATRPVSVVIADPGAAETKVLRQSAEVALRSEEISVAEAFSFTGYGGATAHALLWRPRNRDVSGPPDELPPLIVQAHGGPTAADTAAFNLEVQFWTTRGFAYCAVNYAGSTGYGRAYRERLYGTWGVADIEDCIAAARHLVSEKIVDGARLTVTGGSAGGWVVLCALAFHDDFAAGASHYGVADLEMLLRDTHKFEARYFDFLVGPMPESAELMRERSPLHSADRIATPLLLLQGSDDAIVPPNQSEAMFEAVRSRGIPCAYLLFAGEQHGFRRADSIIRALGSELTFYARVFGFEADGMVDLEIANL